jgi:hypothetical protein
VTQVFAFFLELENALGGQLGYTNTVAPLPEHYLAPWARATGPAARDLGPDGLPKFDLDTWDERYFARLRAFLSAAAVRNVVVEIDIFVNPFDAARWTWWPLHPGSNVNGVGAALADSEAFRLYADPSVVDHERRLVRKLVTEANSFDNVYYEICGEPSLIQDGVPRPDLVRDWHRVMVETLRETERALPKRHLVAVNAHQVVPAREAAPSEVRIGLLDDGYYLHDPQVDLLNVHYISHRLPREGLNHAYPGGARPRGPAYRLGNMATFMALRRPAGKAIAFNEDWNGIVHHQTPHPVQARLEAWESLLAGCASYQHLDYSFTTDDPTGAAAGTVSAALPREWFDGRALRRELSYVAAYAGTLELETLRPDLLAVCQTPLHVGTVAAHVARGGQEALALYLVDLRRQDEGFGTTSLAGAVTLEGLRASSPYTVRALDPQTGAWSSLPAVTADAWGEVRLEVPAFREDMLVELVAVVRTTRALLR